MTTAWTRFKPFIPSFALVTVYTSVTYNYAVQSRLRLESQRLHTLRINALSELRNAVLVSYYHHHHSEHGQDEVVDEEELEEAVRGLLRLGIDPSPAGFYTPSSKNNPSSSSSTVESTGTTSKPRTEWSDVFFGGPNSYRAQQQREREERGGIGSQDGVEGSPAAGESTTEILRRAMKSAFADFQVLGSKSGGDDSGRSKSEEEEAVERWFEQAMENDEQTAPSSQQSTDSPPPIQRVQADLLPPPSEVQRAQSQPPENLQPRRRPRAGGRLEDLGEGQGQNDDRPSTRRSRPVSATSSGKPLLI
ncbi:hypothetical protein CF327_g3922 [Tilletia walkeri]|uniref:Uncharacterized protein n=1 Tax=Tilletia walkeri TaxID=117179 RepID=A0A8X7N566_9BASI|nr:hypothetical protein CF327_g3922 [Tilletia walkeri]KAE8267316.1 hypothetical protein A4X09_0g5033 [Tilletia walkeri]